MFDVRQMGVGIVLLTLGCGGAIANYDYRPEPDPTRSEYVIGVADSLRVNIWRNADLTSDAVVRPDGTITLPLVGDLPAAGVSPSRLREQITARLSEYLKEPPIVTVAVMAVKSYRFTVMGNVQRPGVFESIFYVKVTEAIALAGGVNKFGSPSRTVLIRSDARGTRRIPIDLGAVLRGERRDADLVLMRGDTLYVP